jgi:hypothetical protein
MKDMGEIRVNGGAQSEIWNIVTRHRGPNDDKPKTGTLSPLSPLDDAFAFSRVPIHISSFG